MTVLALSTIFAVPGLVKPAAAAVATTPFSWNPKVGCAPLVVRISGITANQTQQSSFTSSPFNPGITTTVGGQAKRWLTSGATPPGWNAPGPACTVTNSMGTTSLFVQINGIERRPFPTSEGLSNIQRLMKLRNPSIEKLKMEELVDDRIVRRLDEVDFTDSLAKTYPAK